MPPPIINNPAFVDGIAAVLDSIISNLNSGVDYLYADDGIGEKGVHERHVDPAGQKLGSRTQATNIFEGATNFQLLTSADAVPRPGHIVTLRGNYSVVAGDVSPKRVKNKAVQVTVPLEQILNPVITTCVTSLGQIFTDTGTSGGGSFTKTFVAANVRTGATKAWSIEAWTEEYPAAVVPVGMTIASSTGIITYTTPGAGTYYIKVKCLDTPAAAVPVQPNRTGVGFFILTIV